MLRIGRSAAAGFTGAVLLLAGGCGGLPTVVPAGSAGMEVAPDAPRSQPATAGPEQAAAATRTASPPAAPRAPRPVAAAVPRAAEGAPVLSARGTPASGPKAGPRARALSAADRGGAAGSRPAAAPAASPRGRVTGPPAAALPAAGTYAYALSGTSSLGPPPRTSTITVAEAGAGRQLWVVDSRRADGAGMVEELTLDRREAGPAGAGVYMTAYRLDASTGFAGVILEFAPASPVLLTPAAAPPGTTWRFDLGTSADGCAAATGTGEVLDPDAGSAVRRFRLTTTLVTVGPALCVAIAGERTQEIRHPAASLLPIRIDSDMRGRVGAAPFTATTRATRASDAADGASRPARPAVAAVRAHP